MFLVIVDVQTLCSYLLLCYLLLVTNHVTFGKFPEVDFSYFHKLCNNTFLHSQPDPAITSFDEGRASLTLLTTSTRSSAVRYGYSPLDPCTTRPVKKVRIRE